MVDQESHEESMDNSISVTRHKIIFVGDAGVGKTSIIARVTDNPFSENYEMSIGVDFCSKNIKYRGQSIKLQIWDSAGQEKYRGLIPSYVRNAAIVFIVYDIRNKSSFEHIPEWINFIKNIENTNLVLCGNKIDLTPREVQTSEGQSLADKFEIPYFEVSAKTNENIKQMFYSVVAELPTFADNSNKESLIKELQEENGVENVMEGAGPEANDGANNNEIVVDGQTKNSADAENLNAKAKSQCKC